MLILTRRVGETLMIGDEVTVTVLGVKGNQVRIGVNAPKDIAVHREEIYERIKREQEGGADHGDLDGDLEDVAAQEDRSGAGSLRRGPGPHPKVRARPLLQQMSGD